MSSINPFELAEIWAEGLKDVKGLEAEVITYTLQHLGVTKEQLEEALYHAHYEWDL